MVSVIEEKHLEAQDKKSPYETMEALVVANEAEVAKNEALLEENASLKQENEQLTKQLQIHIRAINELKNTIVSMSVRNYQEMK